MRSVWHIGVRRWLLLLLCASVSAACVTPQSVYKDHLDDWTDAEEVYEGFSLRALLHATLKTEAFRRAYTDYYAGLFSLTAEDKRQLLAQELEENRRYIVVVAAFYTGTYGWNELDPNKGFWEVRLEASGQRHTRPERVTRLGKRNPTYRAMYPYHKAHYTLYELRFDREQLQGLVPGEPLSLVIAGAPAQIRLDWTMP